MGMPRDPETSRMPPVLFLVKFKVPKEIQAGFDRWYADEHIPDVIGFPGYVSARRYRTLMGDDEYNEISLFEFRDEVALQRYLTSDHRKRVSEEFDRRFGAATERIRIAYEQIYP
jgi:antibiotic biosynthesis monooxygenase (ABM) superfamily enzyme